MSDPPKPTKLFFQSYLQMVRNSVGSNLFRNFYVKEPQKGEFDALDDGVNSCAFYVSAVLVIFKKLSATHGTVKSTVEDLQKSGWQVVKKAEPGDVLVWEGKQFPDGWHEHIGFYIGEGKAISTSLEKKVPIEHDKNFGDERRRIIEIWRMPNWDKALELETAPA